MDEFLKTEYEQCLSLVKFYDERHISLLKFTVVIGSGVVSIILGVHRFSGDPSETDWRFISLLTGVTTLTLLTIFLAMIQNRLYFVYPARQVNAIRKAMMERLKPDFQDNQMYTSTTFSAFKWLSSQTLMNAFVAILIGVFAGLSYFSLVVNHVGSPERVVSSVALAGVSAFSLLIVSGLYLSAMSAKPADESIHLE